MDEFYGDNQGLVVAEVELENENEEFEKPSWLGVEVTGDVKYYNSMLMKNPFTKCCLLYTSLGGIFIAIGILTFSKKVMSTLGEGILEMTPETAIVVVLSQALVLFIFSSTALSNLFVSMGLPAIPLVPVSSTQVVVGAVIGIGAVKGMQEIRFKQVGNIIIGWIVTPILAGIVTFFSLFFVNNVFQVQITNTTKPAGQHSVIHQVPATINMPAHTGLILLLILAAAVFIAGISIYLQYNRLSLIHI